MSIQEVEVTLEELQSLDQEQIVGSCKSLVYYELEYPNPHVHAYKSLAGKGIGEK